jgi:hypothetical protein
MEDGVRNRHKFYLLSSFLMLSALLLSAQSSVQTGASAGVSDRDAQPVLSASLSGAPALTETSSDSGLPDAPSTKQPDTTTSDNQSLVEPTYSKKHSQGAPPAALGGPFGMEGRTADKKFWGANTAMFGATVANIELTQRCQKNETCSYVPSSINSRFAMYGIALPAEVGVMYLTYHAKERHRSWWYMPPVLLAAANAYVAIHAYHRGQEAFAH